MKIYNKINIKSFLILLIIIGYSFSISDKWTLNGKSLEPLQQVIISPTIKKQYTFAGEVLPMDSFDLYERMDRELINTSYGHSTTLQHIKLTSRYFPIISKILAEYNVPDDFKYMAVAESDLRNVVSSAGATGIWQFMKPTAQELGLKINENIDERYDFEKSTIAAAKYLLKLKGIFGTWINTCAAYNLGMTKFIKNNDDQSESDFFNMNLNSETMRYVFRLAAIKEVLENQENYGFHVSNEEKYKELDDFYLVQVDSTIQNLGQFAHLHNTNYRMLKIYNPWLISTKLPVKDTTYFIKIKK